MTMGLSSSACRYGSSNALLWLFVLHLVSRVSAASSLKVFILAGQSNMAGMASINHLDILCNASDDTTRMNEFRETLWNGSASGYKSRDDVFIKYYDSVEPEPLSHGNLTVARDGGFASKNNFGTEVMFGWTVGDQVKENVLLIKTAWEGKTLAIDFGPPSAGTGNYTGHKAIQFGWYYRAMIQDIRSTLGNLTEYVPGYKKEDDYDLAGFVWFQGWNDMLGSDTVAEYGSNLVHFIRDVRLDLDEPELRFGELRRLIILPSYLISMAMTVVQTSEIWHLY
jgi:hypothetical protein